MTFKKQKFFFLILFLAFSSINCLHREIRQTPKTSFIFPSTKDTNKRTQENGTILSNYYQGKKWVAVPTVRGCYISYKIDSACQTDYDHSDRINNDCCASEFENKGHVGIGQTSFPVSDGFGYCKFETFEGSVGFFRPPGAQCALFTDWSNKTGDAHLCCTP
jgi:hypothetical protein